MADRRDRAGLALRRAAFRRVAPLRCRGRRQAAQQRARTIAELACALEDDRLDAVRAAFARAARCGRLRSRAHRWATSSTIRTFSSCGVSARRSARIDELLDRSLQAAHLECTRPARSARALETGARKGVELLSRRRVRRAARERARLVSRASKPSSTRRAAARASALARELGRDEVAGERVHRDARRAARRSSGRRRVVREAPTYLLCALEYGEAVARRARASRCRRRRGRRR